MNTVSFSNETMVLQEREDRITVSHEDVSDDYRVSSMIMGYKLTDFFVTIEGREYL